MIGDDIPLDASYAQEIARTYRNNARLESAIVTALKTKPTEVTEGDESNIAQLVYESVPRDAQIRLLEFSAYHNSVVDPHHPLSLGRMGEICIKDTALPASETKPHLHLTVQTSLREIDYFSMDKPVTVYSSQHMVAITSSDDFRVYALQDHFGTPGTPKFIMPVDPEMASLFPRLKPRCAGASCPRLQ